MIICQLSTAVPENMTHESHFRAMLQALHHSLVLEDMWVKQVKTVSTFNLAIFSYSLFCLSVFSANLFDQIFSRLNVIVCECCNRSNSDKRSQKPKKSYADQTRRQEVAKSAVEYDWSRRQLQFGFSTVYICPLIHKWNQTITETAVQCCVLFCNLYLLFSDNSRCMSIIYRLMAV